jgi:hypothetical protein
MGYDGARAYIGPATLAAQNIVATASGQIVAGATTSLVPVAEASFIVSIAGVASATPTTPPGGVTFFVLVGTSTTTSVMKTAYAQSSGSSGFGTFVPPVAVAQGSAFQVGIVSTGTASATETAAATTLIIGLAPQFV